MCVVRLHDARYVFVSKHFRSVSSRINQRGFFEPPFAIFLCSKRGHALTLYIYFIELKGRKAYSYYICRKWCAFRTFASPRCGASVFLILAGETTAVSLAELKRYAKIELLGKRPREMHGDEGKQGPSTRDFLP